jgi:putative transcriptional regulator
MSADSAVIDLTHHFLIAMPGLDDELFGKSVVYICEHSDKGALGLVINKPSDIPLSELFAKIDLKLARPDMAKAPVFQGGPVQTERGFVLHAPMGKGSESVYSSTIVIQAKQQGPSDLELADQAVAELTQHLSRKFSAHLAQQIGDALAASEEDPDETDDDVGDETAQAGDGHTHAGVDADRLEMTTSKDVLEAMSEGAGPSKVLVTLGYSTWGKGQLESEIAENAWLTVAADQAIIFDTPPEQRYTRAMGLLGLDVAMLSSDVGHA